MELVGYQCSVFGQQPPVFRRPANQPPPVPNPGYAYSHPSQAPRNQTTYEASPGYPAANSSSNYASNYAGNTSNYASSYAGNASSYGTPVDHRKEVENKTTDCIQREMRHVYRKIQAELDTQFEKQLLMSRGQSTLTDGIEQLKQQDQQLKDGIRFETPTLRCLKDASIVVP